MTTQTEERPYKILVVDDEPDVEPLVLQRMRRQIRSKVYEFVFARNGLEALDVLNQEQDVDLVLSDINMPQMDGLTLLEQIPKVDPNLRSVIISAYGDMKNIRTAMNRGAFDFVTKPIDFEDLQITIDRTLRHMAEWREALESRDKLVALQNELDVASQMQQSILPTEFPSSDRFELYGGMEPARNVGGDFFAVQPLDLGALGLAIADVSDKGVPAALFMMSARTLLRGSSIGLRDPGPVMNEVNNLISADNAAAMFVTLLYATYNPESGDFRYSNGGHNPPIVVRADGAATPLPPTRGIALGLMPDLPYEEDSIRLEPGDSIVMYTDGVTEAMDAAGEEFGMERLQDVFQGQPLTNVQTATESIFAAVHAFSQDVPQTDDITIMILRRTR